MASKLSTFRDKLKDSINYLSMREKLCGLPEGNPVLANPSETIRLFEKQVRLIECLSTNEIHNVSLVDRNRAAELATRASLDYDEVIELLAQFLVVQQDGPSREQKESLLNSIHSLRAKLASGIS
jgi:DNA-directed RNA polymerase alpha subunit